MQQEDAAQRAMRTIIVEYMECKVLKLWTCFNRILVTSCERIAPILSYISFAYLGDEQVVMDMEYVAQR